MMIQSQGEHQKPIEDNSSLFKRSRIGTTKASFNSVPDVLILEIFILLAQLDLKQVGSVTLVCSHWNKVAKNNMIFRYVVSQRYPNLVPTICITKNYFLKAHTIACELDGLASEFSGKNRNLVTYNDYKTKLSQTLNKYPDVLPNLPYFDLRPLAWLNCKDWLETFNKLTPHLKNVQVLEASGIGTNIGFDKIDFPDLPIHGLQASKSIVNKLHFHFGVKEHDDDELEKNIARLLTYCIYTVAKVSNKLTSLKCSMTKLSNEQLSRILTSFPSINDVESDAKWSYRHRDLEARFPNVTFK